MLQTIKEYIASLPDIDFGQFYQEYVLSMQDRILESNVKTAELSWKGQNDINKVLSGINTLTEELKLL